MDLDYQIIQITEHTKLFTKLTAQTWLKFIISYTENEKYFVVLSQFRRLNIFIVNLVVHTLFEYRTIVFYPMAFELVDNTG